MKLPYLKEGFQHKIIQSFLILGRLFKLETTNKCATICNELLHTRQLLCNSRTGIQLGNGHTPTFLRGFYYRNNSCTTKKLHYDSSPFQTRLGAN